LEYNLIIFCVEIFSWKVMDHKLFKSLKLEEDEDAILEDAADLNLPKEDSKAGSLSVSDQPMPNQEEKDDDEENNQQNDDNREDNDDRLSDISGLSDLSGSDWKPTAGPFSWVQRQMMSGTDPRELLKEILGDVDAVIPDHLDQITLWKIILNMVSEPPRRKKLANVNTLQDVVELIKNSKKIIILTGAGVSVSCGIPDFRSRDGVYARLAVDFPDLPDPQAMFDIHYFRRDPRPFFKFAREIYPGQFNPSPCHRFIRSVEKHGKLLRNYTQNIDTLEQVVGIENVVQCHGSFATATCMKCKHKVDAKVIREDIFSQKIPKCSKCINNSSSINSEEQMEAAGPSHKVFSMPQMGLIPEVAPIMKPDIVFFGEGLGDEFHNAVADDKDQVDLLIMIGSSLKVRPVALIPSSVDPSVPQILINREPLPHLTPDVELLGDCDGIINQICHMLGQGWEDPVHSDPLVEISELTPKTESTSTTMTLKTEENKTTAAGSEPATPSKEATSGQVTSGEEATSGQVTSGEEAATSAGSEAASSKPSSLSNEDLAKMYQPKTRPSLAQRLKSNEFLFTSPNRYVFPGAEVIDRDDESDISSNHSGSDTDSDDEAGDSSDDNVDKKNSSNSNDNTDGSDHKNSENHPDSNPTPSDTPKKEENNPNLATTFNTKTIPNPEPPAGTC
jgi:NAD-dependent deacetylase sirtuin 1